MKLPRPFESWHEHVTVALPGAQVVFTTRRGGFSSGPFESLNLGRLTDDRPENVERNRERLASRVGRPLAMARQVHGAAVHVVDRGWSGLDAPAGAMPEGDGVVSTDPDVAPAVLVADCLPVALAAGNVVAMLHAGWRGLAAGVLAEGARLVQSRDPQAELHAAIGPGIGACCYEVGEEVHQAFASYGSAARRGCNLDLRAVARAQLRQAGASEIHDLNLCTSCSPELWFSHRRDHGVTGRQAGLIWLS